MSIANLLAKVKMIFDILFAKSWQSLTNIAQGDEVRDGLLRVLKTTLELISISTFVIYICLSHDKASITLITLTSFRARLRGIWTAIAGINASIEFLRTHLRVQYDLAI